MSKANSLRSRFFSFSPLRIFGKWIVLWSTRFACDPLWGCVSKHVKSQLASLALFFIQSLTDFWEIRKGLNEKKQPNFIWLLLNFLAEREGFEPPEPLGSTVFKTAAIDHSAISPRAKVYLIFYSDNILCEVFLST
jgi:hypothetical protein